MLNHRLSLGRAEQRLFFPFTCYSHYHVVEQTGRPLDDIEVAVSQGIEAAGINARFQGRDSSRCTLKKEPGQLPGFSRINPKTDRDQPPIGEITGGVGGTTIGGGGISPGTTSTGGG